MCGTRSSAQLFPIANGRLRTFLLGAAISCAFVAPAAAATDCVMGSKAAPADILSACSTIIDQASNSNADRVAALLVRADANARSSGGLTQALRDIDRAIAGFARLARQHRTTAMVARTWLQHALPMPFGLKLAEYAAALHRSKTRLKRIRGETLALQFGGAAGTLAALGNKGPAIAEKLAEEL